MHEKSKLWNGTETLQQMMLSEYQLGIWNLNAKNNKKKLGKEAKGTWQYTYSSSCRAIQRMVWLMSFMAMLFDLLVNTDKTFAVCCGDSYKHAFGAHHPYVIQTASWAVIKWVGSREWMSTQLGIKDLKVDLA